MQLRAKIRKTFLKQKSGRLAGSVYIRHKNLSFTLFFSFEGKTLEISVRSSSYQIG